MIRHIHDSRWCCAVGGCVRAVAVGVALALSLSGMCYASQPVVADAGRDWKLPILTDDAVKRPVVLDGSFSYSNLGLGLSYRWLWDGSEVATGPIAHVMIYLGEYDVLLEVTDSEGNIDTDVVHYKIYEPTGPTAGEWAVESQGHQVVAYAGSDVELALDPSASTRTVELDGSDSFSRLGLDLRYSWRYGGSEVSISATPSVDLGAGTHTIVLKILDAKGNVGADTVNVKIVEAPGSAPVGCASAGAPLLALGLLAVTVTVSGVGRNRGRTRRMGEPQ